MNFADTESPICPLAVKPHFEALTQKEKLYGIVALFIK
jgi:hypothetical protein